MYRSHRKITKQYQQQTTIFNACSKLTQNRVDTLGTILTK